MPVISKILNRSSRKPIANYFHHNADNVGDRACGAAQYFWPDTHEAISFNDGLASARTIIFGGGQIFAQTDQFSSKIRAAHPNSNLIAWGIGIPIKWRKDSIVREVAERFSLFSTRNYEWKDQLEFVPCVSCMSSFFDNAPTPRHEVVIYSHRKKTPHLKPIEGIPYLTNAAKSLKESIDFLASGETIVTSSYHGVYWGQLLGRRVICIPFNDKFQTFQYPPVFADTESWRQLIGKTTPTPKMLEDYRQINMKFSDKVQEITQQSEKNGAVIENE